MVHRFLSIVTNAVFAVGELWAWARGNRRRVRVSGRSMEPTLHDGDTILIADPVTGSPGVGRVVVAEHPDPGRSIVLIKRLESLTATGAMVLRGDNPSVGTDSRSFGPVDRAALIGEATIRLNSLRRLEPRRR